MYIYTGGWGPGFSGTNFAFCLCGKFQPGYSDEPGATFHVIAVTRSWSPLYMNTITFFSKERVVKSRNWAHMNWSWKHFLLFPLSGVTDSAGVTLAHVAAREGHLTCIQTLVDHDIDVTIPDKDGRSPADYAYSAGQTGCARYLVMEESCWLLSLRIARLHKELKDCKEENKELRQRLEASCYLCCRCLTHLYLRLSDTKTSTTKRTRFFSYN